jgi:hypothetical protein
VDSDVGNHKVALPQIQIHERSGRFRRETALSISAVQIADQYAERENRY